MIQIIKKQLPIFIGMILFISLGSFNNQIETQGYSLTVKVDELRNNNGVVVFALYNRNDAFPDEHYKKYFKILPGDITNGSSVVRFENLPAGRYAVNILHDEDKDGKIKKGVMLPKEGIGFSNYQSIGLFNRPTFNKSSFSLQSDEKIKVNIIYL
jgi:uncharacterized protein (DUF2141 family)